MSWRHVNCRWFLANMGDMQILRLNESREWHVTSCCVSSTTLLSDVVCCLFLSIVVMQQKRMLTWCHICHVGDISWNVTCRWRCCRPSCYGNRQQFLLRPQKWWIQYSLLTCLHTLVWIWHCHQFLCLAWAYVLTEVNWSSTNWLWWGVLAPVN